MLFKIRETRIDIREEKKIKTKNQKEMSQKAIIVAKIKEESSRKLLRAL